MQESIIRWMLSSKQLHFSLIQLKPLVFIWRDSFESSSLMRVERAFFLMNILRLTFFFLRQKMFTVNNTMSWSLKPGTTLTFSMMLELLERIRSKMFCVFLSLLVGSLTCWLSSWSSTISISLLEVGDLLEYSVSQLISGALNHQKQWCYFYARCSQVLTVMHLAHRGL